MHWRLHGYPGDNLVRLRLNRHSRTGREQKTCSTSIKAWVEAGNDEDDFHDAYEEWFAKVSKIIRQANTEKSEETFDKMFAKVEHLRLAPTLVKRTGSGIPCVPRTALVSEEGD